MGSRRKAREETLKLLYQAEIRKGEDPRQLMAEYWKENPPPDDVREYARSLFFRTLENREKIDETIRGASSHWTLDRIGLVELNILRFAVCEILFRKDIPAKVAINEAVDIAKDFGTDDSGSFVNGVLDRILKDSIASQIS